MNIITEDEMECIDTANIIKEGIKRVRHKPKLYVDEKFVKGSGCVKRRGYDETDMKS